MGLTRRNGRAALGAAGLCLVLAATATGEDWPQWRGPQRSGVTTEHSGWPKGWPPKKLWSASVGPGASSPVIGDGKVFAMGWQGHGRGQGDDAVVCLDAASGKVLWKQTYRSRYQGRHATGDQGRYGGPNSTPAYDAGTGYLFTLGIDGDFRCWDAARGGKLVWAKNLYDEYRVPQRPNAGGGKRDFGFCSAPLPHGEVVILDVGGPAGLVMGFEKTTGKQRWRSQSAELAGSNSGPALITVGGAECVASLGLRALVITRIDPGGAGRTVGQTRWQTEFACNIATPGVLGNKVVLTSAYNMSRTTMFEVAAGGGLAPRWNAREHALVSSPVVHGEEVFLPEGALHCLDLASGKRKWSTGRLGNGSCLVTGDGKVIAQGRGVLWLVDPADKGKELSSVKGVPSGWPSVALGGGLIVCKDNGGRVAALSVSAGQPSASAVAKPAGAGE